MPAPPSNVRTVAPVSVPAACLGEFLGTFLLVLFGCGSVHAAVLTNAQSGLWQVAVVWGVAIMLAAYVVGGISGAHINPAITVSLAVWRGFPWARVPPYVLAQLVGAFAAAGALFGMYAGPLADKEGLKFVERGQPGSEITAMRYGEYYPNPGPLAAASGPYSEAEHARFDRLVGTPAAVAAEFLGTLILALVVFAVTDERNSAAPLSRLAPVFIGLTVAALISIIAPLTQACFNPARDFGPRLFASLAGWGEIALPGRRGTGTYLVYLMALMLGSLAGGGFYQRLLRPRLPPPADGGA